MMQAIIASANPGQGKLGLVMAMRPSGASADAPAAFQPGGEVVTRTGIEPVFQP